MKNRIISVEIKLNNTDRVLDLTVDNLTVKDLSPIAKDVNSILMQCIWILANQYKKG